MTNITVLGAGSWGIAVANLLQSNQQKVQMWEFDKEAALQLQKTREEPLKLPGVILNEEILVSNDLSKSILDAQVLVFAVPAQEIRSVCEQINDSALEFDILVSLSKGIEVQSMKRVSQVIQQVMGSGYREKIVAISGPSHAEEVARQIPTSVVAAGNSSSSICNIQQMFSSPYFRVYTSTDLIGVELGGSLKNIIALAAGIIYGLKLGDNTIGALLTRGLAEISRLGIRLGARAETFSGLSGIGDLITTCNSRHSRNRFVGERIGQGENLTDILSSMAMVAEGVETTRAAVRLAEKYNVEMPITFEIYQVLFENKSPQQALADLMTRELKKEVSC